MMNKFDLSIKRWFLIFLIIFLVIPILTTRVVVDIYERFNSPYKDYELESLDVWMTNHVLNDIDEWDNLGWQKSISKETDKIGITLKLVNEDNQVLFSNINNKNQYELNTDISKEDAQISNIVEEYPVYTQGKLKGVAYMQDNRIDNFNPMPSQWMYYLINEWGGAFVWLSIFIAILIISTKFIKKKMLYPLREFKKATDSISHQNFNFSVPYTPIKELNELSDAILIMQRTLKQSLDRQNQMEKERKIFISSIIHDLRTPLFSIRGYLEGIKKGIANTPDKLNKYIDISYDKANILNQLIDDLYTFTKVNYIDTNPKFNDMDLTLFIDNIVKGFYPLSSEKEITLKTDYKIDENTIVKGDKYLLSRALENIIGNAIRYTPNKGNVFISVDRAVNNYSIKVRDNGIGIPSHEINAIFSPLYRGEKSRNRKTGGSGLGLSIAKQIVEKHKGDIQVWSSKNQGTVFEITLPCVNE
ncbi:hypothetical protein ABD68_00010 [Bacillus endophyticus]|nr:hypothetical protein [Priestia endophytica]